MRKLLFAVCILNMLNMSSFKRSILLYTVIIITTGTLFGQNNTYFRALLRTPFVSNLNVSQEHDIVLYSINNNGARNVYASKGPNFESIKLTNFNEDDGQEITNLQLSADGQHAVFVRGGDHGGNISPVPVNPTSSIEKQEIVVYAVNLKTKKVIKIDNGDYPVVHPFENKVVYIKSNQIWISTIGNSGDIKPLFHAKGVNRTPKWSPNGDKLAFVSRRNTHSFIGVYEEGKKNIEWIAPSFHIDNTPRWSPCGNAIAFIRREASGGERDSLTTTNPVVWDIMKYDFNKAAVTSIYKSPNTIRGSLPKIAGATNLNWPLHDEVVFMSYKDGWPHLYKVNVDTKEVIQLTKGDFEVKHLNYNKSGDKVLFAANWGNQPEDRDRVHIGMVDLKKNNFKMLTEGSGIEVSPMFLGKEGNIVYLKGGVKSPFLPEVKNLQNGKIIRMATKKINLTLYEDFVVPEQVSFKTPDGLKLNGQLFTPKDNKQNRPALIYIHGGPRRQMYLGWHNIDYYHYDYLTNQYLASQGFVVLSVNYRRGTGYGFDFQNPSNSGPLGAKEYTDILTAGKWLQNRESINPNNIGLFGGSYGGTLTAMGLGKNSDLFKYGVAVHGRHNREKKRNLDFYPPDYKIASKIAWESSPSKHVDSWTSPVLLIHGDDDKNVPFSQSIDIYNRLKKKGVDVEVMVIPDETHHWMLQRNLERIKICQVEYLIKKAKENTD